MNEKKKTAKNIKKTIIAQWKSVRKKLKATQINML